MDEEDALTTSKIRITKTRTSLEATPTLIHGGPPSPLEGSLVPGRPHARRLRPNKSKGPSEDMKVVTMAKLRREPASCGWPANCGTRVWRSHVPQSSDGDAPVGPWTWCSGYVSELGYVNTLGVLDTGATISIVAKKILPRGSLTNTMPTAAICMWD